MLPSIAQSSLAFAASAASMAGSNTQQDKQSSHQQCSAINTMRLLDINTAASPREHQPAAKVEHPTMRFDQGVLEHVVRTKSA